MGEEEVQTRILRALPNPSSGDLFGLFSLLQSALQDSARQAAVIAGLAKDVHEIGLEVVAQSRVLRGEGNGDRGVNWRLMRVEETIADVRTRIESLDRRETTRSGESEKGRWSLTQAALTGMVAFLTAVTVAVLSALMQHRP